jgi:hypothetical protein
MERFYKMITTCTMVVGQLPNGKKVIVLVKPSGGRSVIVQDADGTVHRMSHKFSDNNSVILDYIALQAFRFLKSDGLEVELYARGLDKI